MERSDKMESVFPWRNIRSPFRWDTDSLAHPDLFWAHVTGSMHTCKFATPALGGHFVRHPLTHTHTHTHTLF